MTEQKTETARKRRVRDYAPALPEIPERPPEAEWDGTRTRLKIRNTSMFRGDYDDEGNPTDPVLLGDGDTAEFRCSEVHGRWVGPEARHVQQLLERGLLTGLNGDTAQASALASDITMMEREWATDPDPRDPEKYPGHPELRAARRKDYLLATGGPGPFMLANRLKVGLEGMKRLERSQVAESQAQDQDRTQQILDAIRGGGRTQSLAGIDPVALAAFLDSQKPEAKGK